MAGGLAAVLAIVIGAKIGRELLLQDQSPSPPSSIRFHETEADVSLAYPASWKVQPAVSGVALLVSDHSSASLQMSVRVTGFDDITPKTLPVIRRQYTDVEVRSVKGVKLLAAPQPVRLGGVPGWRYRYTYGRGAGEHDQYFLFKRGRVISLVFQALPASRLTALEPEFDRIAASFHGHGV